MLITFLEFLYLIFFFFFLFSALPEEGPKISGGKPRYQIGDTVNVNCTSGSSNPPAQLDWFINGEKVSFIARFFFLYGFLPPFLFSVDMLFEFRFPWLGWKKVWVFFWWDKNCSRLSLR